MENLAFNPQPHTTLLLTPEGHETLKKELEHLMSSKRPEIAERIRESQQNGEFSEDNNELEGAKFEQILVESRIAELKAILANAHILTEDEVSTDHVGIGSFVKVRDLDRGAEFVVRIVTSFEANPDEDLISNESPMGLSLWGQSAGAKVTFEAPVGKIHYEILSIKK